MANDMLVFVSSDIMALTKIYDMLEFILEFYGVLCVHLSTLDLIL